MICPVCSNEMVIRSKKVDDVYICTNKKCKHVFVDFQGDANEFHMDCYRTKGHGTRTTNEINDDGFFTKKFHTVRKKICEKRLAVLKTRIVKTHKTLMDVGAGGGSFARMVRDETDLKVECQEVSTICIKNLKKDKFKVYSGDFITTNFRKKYDIVTAWHVMEHVKDVKGFAKNISQITKKICIIEVPIAKSPNGGFKKPPNRDHSRWDGHHHFFNDESITLLFKDYFKIIKVQEFAIQKPSVQVIMYK
tara:strand:+ start:1241 stop:1987 length:747 start_codon:yes stop_codon:yes gene_type:complete